jgi:magnesium transporter
VSDSQGSDVRAENPGQDSDAPISLPPADRVRAATPEESPPSPLTRRRAPTGSVPGTLAIPSDAPPIELRAIAYSADRFDEFRVEDPAALRDLLEEKHVLWLDVVGLGDGTVLSEIGELLGIHPLAVADVVHAPQRPKLEDYGDRHLIVLQMARSADALAVDLEQVTMVLGPTWVVTFQERPGDVFDPIRHRLRQRLGALRAAGPDYLAYALVDAIVDGFFPVLERLGDQMQELEERVLTTTDRRNLRDIHATRRLFIQLHKVLWGQRDALSAMLRDDASPFGRSVHVFLRDTYDHSVQLLDLVETSRDLAAAILEIHLSTVNNRMNEVMKTLTVMASIFIPLTFLAGVYGMNFRYMPELAWRWAYPSFWLAMLGIAALLLLWFRRRGWLSRDDDA